MSSLTTHLARLELPNALSRMSESELLDLTHAIAIAEGVVKAPKSRRWFGGAR